MMHATKLAAVLFVLGLAACASSPPPVPEVATPGAPAAGKTSAHGSGGGTGAHGHSKEAAGNKDGLPGGTTAKHGSGEGGGRNSEGKTGQAAGNKDGHPGGTSTEHGTGHGAGRGGGKKAHQGDKNGKPGPQ